MPVTLTTPSTLQHPQQMQIQLGTQYKKFPRFITQSTQVLRSGIMLSCRKRIRPVPYFCIILYSAKYYSIRLLILTFSPFYFYGFLTFHSTFIFLCKSRLNLFIFYRSRCFQKSRPVVPGTLEKLSSGAGTSSVGKSN